MIFIKRIFKYILLSIKWHGKCKFSFDSEIAYQSRFEGCNRIFSGTTFRGKLGFGSYIAHHSVILANVGRFTSIASNCRIASGRHPYTAPFVTTSPMFFSLLKQNGDTFATEQMFKEYNWLTAETSIEIGSDCWIGDGVTFIDGVSIATGAVVLANAVVTKDVPPYSIVGGIPAKVLRYRYDEETIHFLLNSKWWEKDPQWLRANWRIMTDLNLFKKKFELQQ